MSLHGLILAAGAGSRFEGIKPLADLGSQSLLDRTYSLADSLIPGRVHIVLGNHLDKIQAALSPCQQSRVLVSRAWSQGIGHSIAEGVAGLPSSATGVLILLCDQVAISIEDLQKLIQCFQRTGQQQLDQQQLDQQKLDQQKLDQQKLGQQKSGRHQLESQQLEPQQLVAASYAGKVGVPAIFPRRYFAQLTALTGDTGAKSILINNDCLRVNMPSAQWDIDTQADLSAFRNSYLGTFN